VEHDHVLGEEGLRGTCFVEVVAEANDGEAGVGGTYTIAVVVAECGSEGVVVVLFGAEECFPAGEVLVVGIERVLVVESRCESKDVVLGHALAKGLHEGSAVRLCEGLACEEVLRDFASLVQSLVGTESCPAKRLLIGLWIDLLERVVSEDRITSTVASKVEDHLGFAISLCLPNEIAHSILKPLNTVRGVI
jgi:hypothetical protein